MLVLKPLQEAFEGKQVIAICIHDDSAHLGEASLVCEMMTMTMELGKQNLAPALKYYGEACEEAALPIGENWRPKLYRH
jgi:hypothetical protein